MEDTTGHKGRHLWVLPFVTKGADQDKRYVVFGTSRRPVAYLGHHGMVSVGRHMIVCRWELDDHSSKIATLQEEGDVFCESSVDGFLGMADYMPVHILKRLRVTVLVLKDQNW